MNHQHTRIYQETLQLVADCAKLWTGLPRGFGFLVDQLKRASSAIPLTFAEGCRRTTPGDRRHFFDIAAASAREVSAIADVASIAEATRDHGLTSAIKQRCDHICAMLYKFR